jgi:hypothetical protein
VRFAKLIEIGFSLNHELRNWGDLLLRESAGKLFDFGLISQQYSGGAFGGSILSKEWFENFQSIGAPLLLYGCGVRSTESLVIPDNVKLYGVRGRLSESVLGVKAIGDPGIFAPLALGIEPNNDSNGGYLFVPHKNDRSIYSPNGFEKSNPLIPVSTNSASLVNKIANSSFVLTGSLHVGIVAFALGVPFCFFQDEYLDIPLKFHDFADFYNLPITFAPNPITGIDFFLDNRNTWGSLQNHHFDLLLSPVSEFLNRFGISSSERIKTYLDTRERTFAKKSKALLKQKWAQTGSNRRPTD